MDLNVLADKMSNFALSSNDVPFNKIQQFTNLPLTFAPNPNINVNFSECKYQLFCEYFYYKAFLVSFYTHVIFSSQIQMNEMNQLVELYMERLRISFNNNMTGFGNDYDTFVSRYNAYFDIGLKYLDTKSQVIMMDKMHHFFASNLGYNRESSAFIVSVLQTNLDSLHQYVRTEINKFNKSNGGSSCFVATATYQDVMHPNVVLLRDFRDRILRRSVFGRLFIDLYYKVGPVLSYFPENSMLIRRLSKKIIDRIVLMIKSKYY